MHAGIRPGISLRSQASYDLTHLRYLENPTRPWYHDYHGKKPVIFGHWPRKKPLHLKQAIGLDTGCVYGGKLTALILPEGKFVSVKAKKIYWQT